MPCFRAISRKVEQKPQPASDWVDVDAGFEVQLVPHLDGFLHLPLDADVLHPVNRGIGLPHKGVGENGIYPVLRHAIQIRQKILARIRRDMHPPIGFLVKIGHEFPNFLGA